MTSRRLVFAAACLGMLVFGIVLTTVGALLPSLIERFGIDRVEAGSLFFLLSLGILAGSLVFGPVADAQGYKRLMIGSCALVLIGLQMLAFAPGLGWLRAAVVVTGFGGGIINGAANAVVADISAAGRSAGLSILGIFFGVGAVGVPFTLGMLLQQYSYSTIVSAVGTVVLLPIGLVAVLRFPAPKQPHGFPIRQGLRLVRDPVLILFGLMLFLQSGMEITVGGWTAAFFNEVLAMSGDRALLFLSLYWFGMMLARLVLGGVLLRVPPAPVLVTSVATAFVGSILLLTATTAVPAGVGVFLLGAGFAAAYPVVLGYVGDRYAALSGTAFSIVIAMGLVGGMTLPYVAGVTGETLGLRSSFVIVPFALAAFIALFTLILRRARGAQVPA
jgi:MFS transporter, FHS family, glucose/mannose:H+ symporter